MEKNNLPFASIIVPVYNGEKTIAECIESLLNQDYPKNKYEIIVVDNNSKDKIAEVIKRYPVKYVLEDRIQSSYAARNTGAKISKGEALVFFDADQTAKKDWLRNLLQCWDQKEFGAFGGRRIAVVAKNNMTKRLWQQNANKGNANARIGKFSSNYINHCFLKLSTGNAAYRREVFEELGGFDSKLFSLGDYDLALRLQKKLSYLIKYNFDAVIYHKERLTLKSSLKRQFRTAFGRYQFEFKHLEFRTQLWVSFIKVIKRTILGLAVILVNLLKPIKEKKIKRKEKMLIIIFDITREWTGFLGRMLCALTRGKRIFPASW